MSEDVVSQPNGVPARESGAGAGLVLGPLLRYVGTTTATVWVETDAADGRRGARTPGEHLSGVRASLRTRADRGTRARDRSIRTRCVYRVEPFGRRETAGRAPRFGRAKANDRPGWSSDPAGSVRPRSLPIRSRHPTIRWAWVLTRCGRIRVSCSRSRSSGPTGSCLIGDQVYVDEVPPETAAFIRGRRDVAEPPGEEIADFEEYTRLFRESWSDPDIRWLLATVPSTMIFDDHEVSDDWNISQAWVEEMRLAALVGRADHRGVHGVLALPAPGQPLAS